MINSKWSKWILLYLFMAALLQLINGQPYFTKEEKVRIGAIHRQRLANEALKIFEKLSQSNIEGNEIFKQMANYRGLYENLDIIDIMIDKFKFVSMQNDLIGFDYKRHNNMNHLLFFTNSSLSVQTFNVVDRKLSFDLPLTMPIRLEGTIKKAKFFQDFENDRLFVIVLLRRGIYSAKMFEVEKDTKLIEKEMKHEFQLHEKVISIEVVRMDSDKKQIVALIDSGRSLAEYYRIKTDKKVVKVIMPGALHLRKVYIQAQPFIVFGNSSHWGIVRYYEEETEAINFYQVQSPIVDVRIFNNGHRYYVVITCQNQQLIYRWKVKSGFRGVSKIIQNNVYKINVVTISYARVDNFFYFDQYNDEDMLRIYTYDITNSIFTTLGNFNKTVIGYPNVIFDSRYSAHFFDKNLAFELKLSNSTLYIVSFNTVISNQANKQRRKVTNHNLQRYDKSIIEDQIKSLSTNVRRLETQETISKQILNLNFTFDVEFRANVIVNHYESMDQKIPERIVVNENVFENEEILVPLPDLYRELNKVRGTWDQVNHILHTDVVFKSTNAEVGGVKNFVNRFFANKIQANEARIGMFKNEYVNNILGNLYRTTLNQKILAKKTFNRQVFVNQFLNVKHINRIDPEHFMYAQLDQIIDANFWYKQLNVDRLIISDRLTRNVHFSRAILINQVGEENQPITIHHRPLFHRLNVERLNVEKINNISITLLAQQLLMKNSPNPQIFNVRVSIPSLYTPADIECKTINSYNTTRLLRHLIRTKANGIFRKDVIFKSDVFVNRMDVKGQLNGIDLKTDIVNKFTDQTIRGVKKFSQLSLNTLNAKRVNELSIPEDVVTLKQDEHIKGRLIFDSLQSDKELSVHGLIDGVNTTHLDKKFIESLNNHYHNVTFYKSVNVKTLKVVNGLVNGLNLNKLYNNAILKNERILTFTKRKIFTNGFRCQSIVANRINGKMIEDFVSTINETHFDNVIRFNNFVQFGHVMVAKTIDNVDVRHFMENVVTLNEHQDIYGLKNFTTGIRVNQNLFVTGLVNGRPVSEWLLYNEQQNITAKTLFHNVMVNQLDSIGNNEFHLTGTINDKNITHLFQNAIDTSRPYTLDVQFYCQNCTAANIRAVIVNGQNFNFFLGNYLSKSRIQTIDANVHFKAVARFDDMRSRMEIHGINFTKLKEQAILLRGHNVFTKPMIIHGHLNMKNGRIMANLVNGVNITDFREKVVFTNASRPIKIYGNIIYQNGFDLHADMNVNRLNGERPQELILTNTGNHTIHSNVRFKGKVVASNIRVKGFINGINLVELDRSILKMNDHGEVMGSINLMTKANIIMMKVFGLINGVQVNRQRLIMLNNEQHINELVINGPVYMNDSLIVMSHINDWHKDNLAKIIMVNSNVVQWINATKTFVRLEADILQQMKGDVYINSVNGVNLEKFEEEAIYSGTIDKTIKVSQEFIENVTILDRNFNIIGRVNGIDLEHDVIRLDKVYQKINGLKTFDNVIFNEDVDVFGQVNGFYLNKTQRRILYTFGNQNVTTPLMFKAPIFFIANSTVRTINNLIPNQLVTLHQPHRLNGKVYFNNIIANKIITPKLINGLNLTEVAENALYKSNENDKEQLINGNLVIDKAIFNKNVQLDYHINNIDLSDAVAKTKTLADKMQNVSLVEAMTKQYADLLKQTIYQYEHANFEIEYFDEAQFGLPNEETKKLMIIASKLTFMKEVDFADLKFSHYLLKENGTKFQLFWHSNRLHIAQTRLADNQLEVFYFVDSTKRITIYRERLPSNSKALLFSMDGQMHIIRGKSYTTNEPQCSFYDKSQTKLQRIDVDHQDLSVKMMIVQTFPENNIINMAHYKNEYNHHYLILNHIINDVELSMTKLLIYRRTNRCLFEHHQTIEASGVHSLVPFKFGSLNLMEQYLATASKEEVNVWMQQGVLGFHKRWTMKLIGRVKVSPAQMLNEVFPYVYEGRELRIIGSNDNCDGIDSFVAHINGLFSKLLLSYDDYV